MQILQAKAILKMSSLTLKPVKMKKTVNFRVLTKKEQRYISGASTSNNCIQFSNRCCISTPGISIYECLFGGICTTSGRCILPVS